MREIKFEFLFYNGLVNEYAKYQASLENLLEDNINIESIHEWINENHTCTSWTDWEYEIIAKRQYTGLKDKNGVEIYEGDILSFDAPKYSNKPSPNQKIIGTKKDFMRIDSVDGGFVWVRNIFWNYNDYLHFGESLANVQNKTWLKENCEVIGNIYENKELLKGEE